MGLYSSENMVQKIFMGMYSNESIVQKMIVDIYICISTSTNYL
jgi:hypothetical protein